MHINISAFKSHFISMVSYFVRSSQPTCDSNATKVSESFETRKYDTNRTKFSKFFFIIAFNESHKH